MLHASISKCSVFLTRFVSSETLLSDQYETD